MGLMDSLADKLKRALGGAQTSDVLALVTGMLTKSGTGDIAGIVAKLEEAGLGAEVKSWVGDGANLPISADQIQSALGNEQVQQIASHLGLPVDDALKLLAEHLPTAVNQASTEGTLPAKS